MHHFQFDQLLIQTIEEIWLPIVPYILGPVILAVIALFLTRPKSYTQYEFKPQIRHRNRVTHRNRSLWRSFTKTRSNKPYRAYRHTSASQADVDSVGSGIDRFCNAVADDLYTNRVGPDPRVIRAISKHFWEF